jgi:protein arginine N-methyltransferase 1
MAAALPPATTVLHLTPGVLLRVETDRSITIERAGALPVTGSTHALAILEAFRRPQAIGQVVAALGSRMQGTQDWIDLTSQIAALYQDGVLAVVGEGPPAPAPGLTGPAAAELLRFHTRLLNDDTRTKAFVAAVRGAVRAGDVVVEVGTGTGVLAVTAARAGARRVYAIEAEAMADAAEAVFRDNAVGDRVELVRGWSTQVSLPERADVLVCELIGDAPLAERMVEIVLDARRRLLKPGARIVPERLGIFGLPVSIPEASLPRPLPSQEDLDRWQALYGVDFTSLRTGFRPARTFYVEPRLARDWPAMGGAVLLADVDFCAVRGSVVDRKVECRASRSGMLNGVLLYFELDLGCGLRLSTSPAEADDRTHWFNQVWVLPEDRTVKPGDAVSMAYRYRVAGAPDGVEVVGWP